jgi:hypothetical protein
MTKKIIVIILFCTLLITPARQVSAGYWSENFSANAMKQMLEEISTQIREAIFSAAKMAAIKQATSSIENALYGGNSSPRNIKNFEEFLIQDPQEKAVTYAQDFLTTSLRGTTSGDYTSMSGSGGSGLSQALESAGESVINNLEGNSVPRVDYMEHCPSDGDFFADGNFKCFSAIMSNSLNTPIGMALAVDQVANTKYQQQKEVAELEATSSGTLRQKDEQGNTVVPKSVVEEIQLQQITLPLEALANGDNNAFSSLIQSFAVQLVTNVIERGLGEVEQGIEQNLDAFERQYQDELGNLSDTVGPAAEYSGNSYNYINRNQDANTDWINPDTGLPGI